MTGDNAMAMAGWKGLVWSGDWVANINAQTERTQ